MAGATEATQEFVPIREVRDGVVVLKDGSLRSILLASSVNFALKSADEQTAIIAQFQQFLNSLDFSVQFFIQSRALDIRPYLALLEDRYTEQLDDLMKIQIRSYITYIRDFTERANIMAKSFFVVVSYDPSVVERGGGVISRLTGKQQTAEEASTSFEDSRQQLIQRIAVVEQGLVRSGVRVAELGTEEVIELFYKLFNPGELEKPMQLAKNYGIA
jgi:type IV secretory pathway VirB4 component